MIEGGEHPMHIGDRRVAVIEQRPAGSSFSGSVDQAAIEPGSPRRAYAATLRPANPRRGGPAGAVGWGAAATGLDGKSATVADFALRSSITSAGLAWLPWQFPLGVFLVRGCDLTNQVALQDSDAASADRIAGYDGAPLGADGRQVLHPRHIRHQQICKQP
jgi:hypothetical protein